jgi:glycogen operon protein
MTDEAWNAPFVRCLGVHLAGDAITEVDDHGERLAGDTMLLLLNQSVDTVPFTLPEHKPGECWELLFDTAEPPPQQARFAGGQPYSLRGRSMAGLQLQKSQPQDSQTK